MDSREMPVSASDGIPIVMYFRLRSQDGRWASCNSFRTVHGIELRFGFANSPPEMCSVVPSHDAAMALAAEWKASLTKLGSFSEAASRVRHL
jgi:hypothetical protein